MAQLQPGLAVTSKGNHLHIWAYKSEGRRDDAADEYRKSGFALSLEKCDVRVLGWATPNRANIDSGCKAFDRQCQGIMTGNVMANTFFSSYIRPRNELVCNGATSLPGRLQDFDLRPFEGNDLHARNVTRYIKKLPQAQTEQLILTFVFHTRKVNGVLKRTVHGAILTDTMLKLTLRFDRYQLGLSSTDMSKRVLNTVTPFLTDVKAINRKPIPLH